MKKEHIKDIDFRSHKERQKNAIEEIKQWHQVSIAREDYSQMIAFSSVLWLLMDKQDYKKYMKVNRPISEQEAIDLQDQEILESMRSLGILQ